MTDKPIPTARNSERWDNRSDGREKAGKYTSPQVEARDLRMQERVRQAQVLRQMHRFNQSFEAEVSGDPRRRGIQFMLDLLHGIREAENVPALIDRDQRFAGVLQGVYAFSAITREEFNRANALRNSAYQYRLQELQQ